jgi:diacylglycerol O-acyltransferase 1
MGGIRLLLENFIKYGIRVDPMQWIIVLTGINEGDESYPSVVLGMCELCRPISINNCVNRFILDATVPIVICLTIEKGLSVVWNPDTCQI